MSTTHIGTQRFYAWVYVAEKITHVNTVPPMQLLRSETRDFINECAWEFPYNATREMLYMAD